ncbi:uncharacterized protein E5676_scaffold306G001290 [Cucumis melo var. makuwa]|uniref:Uncharacterized protein n=1 Tax=Cucumis melo var. makuwa TaxID=1194695 RepID=A0A5A7TGE6_CUCMM|nr:uncharacterized protein E6C27_scaffold67G003440 [Cucumis melo var. makuwa]TYK17859.1 uncharacterized protein E5676_scaffold306G001290 [Cucumis melo var. makuwa]
MKENLAPTQLDLFKMTVFDNFIDMDGIHIKALEEEFKKIEIENDVDAVKMTVSNIELAMKGREKIRAFVDMRLFLDVENIEYFSSLDWENIL